MPAIKLHLEQAEYDAVARLADAIKVKPEAVAYSALNRLMLSCRDSAIRADIADTWNWHKDNLPLWSDSASTRAHRPARVKHRRGRRCRRRSGRFTP